MLVFLQQAEAKKVGHFVSENVPPIAGGAAFSTQSCDALCLNLEGMVCRMKLQYADRWLGCSRMSIHLHPVCL